jgi:hypothetical protein
LAILPSVLIGGALGLIAYSMGNQLVSDYLYLPHLPLSGELIVFCGALIGSGIGFLWYNTYPAQIFMGRYWIPGLRSNSWDYSNNSSTRASICNYGRSICYRNIKCCNSSYFI